MRWSSAAADDSRRAASAVSPWKAATAAGSLPGGRFGTGFTSNDCAAPSERAPLADTTTSSAA